METNNDNSPAETLSQEVIQKLVGKALLEVQTDSSKYFDLFTGGAGEETTLAELAIGAISKLKTVEIIILTTLRSMMHDSGVPDGAVKFLNIICKDVTTVLMLLNGITTTDELMAVYEEEELANPLRAYGEDTEGQKVEATNIGELSKDLNDLMGKVREAKQS